MELQTTLLSRSKFKTVFLIFLSFILVACASGPKFKYVTPPPNKAILYFYQPIPNSGSLGEKRELRVNGKQIAVIPYGAYTYITLAKGEHLIEVYESNSLKWTIPATINQPIRKFMDIRTVKANESIFLKYTQWSLNLTKHIGIGSSEYEYENKGEALNSIKSTRLVASQILNIDLPN